MESSGKSRSIDSSVYVSWNTTLATTLVIALCAGVAISALPLLDPAIEAELGESWSNVLRIKALLTFGVGGLVAIAVGVIVDRQGPRIVLLLGAALTSSACLGYSKLLTAPLSAYLIHIALGIGIACCGPVTAVLAVDRWFDHRRQFPGRGLAVAIGLSAPGLGALIVTPLANWCLAYLDWQQAAWYLALVPFSTLALIALLIPARPKSTNDSQPRTSDGAMTDSGFLILVCATGISSLCFFGLTSHAGSLGEPLAESPFDPGTVVFVLPLIAIGSKLLGGLITDLGRARAVLISGQSAIAVAPALIIVRGVVAVEWVLLLVTIAWSLFTVGSNHFALELAPRGSRGAIVGALVAMQVGGGSLGLWLLGEVRATTGFYQPALLAIVLMAAASTLLIARSRRLALLSRTQPL